jgi:hypothetical protein
MDQAACIARYHGCWCHTADKHHRADDAKAGIAHHQTALERAWRDYYGLPPSSKATPTCGTGRDLCFRRQTMAGAFIVHDMHVGR